MSEAELREVNRIPPRMLVQAGSTLLVPRSDAAPRTTCPSTSPTTAMLALAPDAPALRRVAFAAGKQGDSVAAVAQRYGVSAAQVAQWNDVGADGNFAPGRRSS